MWKDFQDTLSEKSKVQEVWFPIWVCMKNIAGRIHKKTGPSGWLWKRKLVTQTHERETHILHPCDVHSPHWIAWTYVACVTNRKWQCVTFPKYVIKVLASSAVLSWITGSGERQLLSHEDVSSPVQGPCGEKREPSCWPPATACKCVSKPAWKESIQPQGSPEVAAAQALILAANSWDILRQDLSAEPLPNSWPTEIMWYNKRLLFQASEFWNNLLYSTR